MTTKRTCYVANESFVARDDQDNPIPDRFIIAAITENEPGYEAMSGSYPSVHYAQIVAKMYNEFFNYTERDIAEIVASSMRVIGRGPDTIT